MPAERRDHPRIQCRLACAVRLGRARIRGHVLDVSEGGLCILLPERLERDAKLLVTIEVPNIGAIDLETTVWHRHRVHQPVSGKRAWATGLILDKAGPGYSTLVDSDAGLPESSVGATAVQHQTGSESDTAAEADAEPSIFRLRVKAVDNTRSRVLTLSAYSAEIAREAALSDLPGEWTVLDVEAQ
jgi:hypothetical protein